MALLPPGYDEKLLNQSQAPTPSVTPAPAPQQPAAVSTPAPQPSPSIPFSTPSATVPVEGNSGSTVSNPTVPNDDPGLAYHVADALGFGMPSNAEYNAMPIQDKALAYAKGIGKTALNLVSSLPSQLVQAVPSILATGYEGARELGKAALTGGTPGKMGDPHVSIPLGKFGQADSWFKTEEDARASGMGPLAASLNFIGKTFGDITILGGMAESLGALAKPTGPIVPGEQVKTTAPIQQAILNENSKGGVFKKAPDSVNEYYDTTKTVAKQFNGNPGNVKLKLSPTSDGSVEVSIVKLSTDSSLKSKFFGNKGATPSDFKGLSEVKVQSQVIPRTEPVVAPKSSDVSSNIVPLSKEELAKAPNIIDQNTEQNNKLEIHNYEINKAIQNPDGSFRTVPSKGQILRNVAWDGVDPNIIKKISQGGGGVLSPEELKQLGQNLQENGYANDNTGMVVKGYGGNDIILGTTKANGSTEYIVAGIDDGRIRLHATHISNKQILGRVDSSFDFSKLNGKSPLKLNGDVAAPSASPEGIPLPPGEASPRVRIPEKVTPGFENDPIRQDQIDQLSQIGKVNNIDPAVQDAVIKSLTSKDAVGDLTQSEYVKVGQTLGLLDKAREYSPTLNLNPIVSGVSDQLSPRSYFFRSVENKTGIPLASRVEIPMENAQRMVKIATESDIGEAHDIFGKYFNHPTVGDIVGDYMQGNKAAITDNPALTPQEKADFVQIADKANEWFNRRGVAYNVPEEIHIDNYLPKVADRGGIFNLYKEDAGVPGEKNFFAKYKRTGGIDPSITDVRALMGIYSHSGASAAYYGKLLQDIHEFLPEIPPELQGTVKDYIQEKLGYQGEFERKLNNTGAYLNQKLGLNLPPDVARRSVQLIMDTTYAGAMGLNPGTYLRNLISNPFFAYAENGSQGFGDAIAEYLKNPAKANAELASKGFRVDQADPYGSAIANEDTNFGKAANMYRRFTAWTMKGQNLTDSFGRFVTMRQTEGIFNNAIDMYNAGKWTWDKAETAMNLDGMNPVDRQQIRQLIMNGDRAGAVDHAVRMKIDQTQFPYRRGTMGRAFNGVSGKLLTQFGTWTDNYAHMLGNWITTGQYDKFVRFLGVQGVVYNTMLNGFKLNYQDNNFPRPLVPSTSPAIKVAGDIINGITAWNDGNAQELEKNKDDLVAQAKSLGFPGVEPSRVIAFNKSYNAGPDANGKYTVYDIHGKSLRQENFSDLWWDMFGFPTNTRVQNQNFTNDIYGKEFDQTNAINQILEKLGSGDTAGASAIMKRTGAYPSASQIQSYFKSTVIPLNTRLFLQAPPQIQAQMANQFQNINQ